VGARSFDPAEMALRGRIGAFVTHSRHDARETTAKARASFLARFELQVDPDRLLPEPERERRAAAARRAYFARLALASARARAARRHRVGSSTPKSGKPGGPINAEPVR
jgi:hypothetical protein